MQLSRFLSAALAGAAVLATTSPALCYPNAVIFAPTAEAKPLGQTGTLVYTAFYGGNPWVWTGVNLGVAPRFPYGTSGLAFGGLEVGLDVASQQGANPGVKPMLNAKAQLLEEHGLLPSLGVGLYGWAPATPARSLNMAYASLTKTLDWSGLPLGRLTAGAGQNFPGAADVFHATDFFPADSHGVVLAGYEFPAIGPLAFAVDHVSGVSDVGSTNLGATYQLSSGTYLGLGYTMSNDRSVPFDTVFAYLYSAADPLKAWETK